MFKLKKKNTGKQYEELVRYVYEQLSNFSGKNIKVERNVKIVGKSGTTHQIDVYYQFEMNGITHRVIIECKDHNKRVEKSMIQSFKGVIDDIGNCTGIFASRNGFQSGAKEYAKYYDIELISGGETPLLAKVLDKKIGILLPDKNIIGQPFWTIMKSENNDITGSYILIAENTIGLFISKKCAEEIAKKTGGTVRGVCQKHLRAILTYTNLSGLKICMFLLDSQKGLVIESRAIEEYFIV
ncbi:restriction endonuclease [Paraclostridium bifermentans]|uniref:restriction endonuclease n=1 Tax=Paraclostridium bifermentans TaxID=1490 RepID=UPI00359C3288